MPDEPVAQPEATPTPEPTPDPTPAPPVKSWQEQAFTDEALRSDDTIKRYKTPDEFGKAFKEQRDMVGRKGIILPNENDPNDMDRYLNQLGRPETSDKYENPNIEVEEEYKQFYSEDRLNGFKEIAHKYGLTQKQFEGITKEYSESQLDEIIGYHQKCLREREKGLSSQL